MVHLSISDTTPKRAVFFLLAVFLAPPTAFCAIPGASPAAVADISGGTFTGVSATSLPANVNANVNAPERNVGVMPVIKSGTSSTTSPSVVVVPGPSRESAASASTSTKSKYKKVKETLPPSADRYIYTEPMTNSVVRDILIDETVNNFNGYCACPWNINHEGYECGIESAYYRPGGFRIDCYPQDFRGQQFIFYRKTH